MGGALGLLSKPRSISSQHVQMPEVIDTVRDPDVKRALDWFLSFLCPSDWRNRKEAIEAYLELVLEPRSSRELAQTLEPVSINDDRIAWYLYLAETSLYAIHKYEPTQGARVLPIFKFIRSNFE